jgi:predicted RNase H-like nuclease
VNARSPDSALVVGVDGYARGWVAVALEDGRFDSARTVRSFRELYGAFPEARCIAVDIPIGAGPRAADEAARRFIGPRWAAVFPTPPAEVIELDDYREAVRAYASLSRQSFALFGKIREVAECLRDHVVEVHPEVSFRALKGAYLAESKRTWNGFMERRALLAAARIELPDALPTGMPLVDVLDAAAAAWSAARHADARSSSLGDPPAIWY